MQLWRLRSEDSASTLATHRCVAGGRLSFPAFSPTVAAQAGHADAQQNKRGGFGDDGGCTRKLVVHNEFAVIGGDAWLKAEVCVGIERQPG